MLFSNAIKQIVLFALLLFDLLLEVYIKTISLSKIIFPILLLLLFSCGKKEEDRLAEKAKEISDYEPVSHNLLDESMLQIPLDYPVQDLKRMINRILPDTLVNDSIDLNDNGDYLVLKVVPLGNMMLNSYQNNLDASLPVKALVYIKKKFVAFNFKNKKPIELKLRLDLHTILSIDEAFDLRTTCTIQQIQWIEEPKMRVAGIKVNLKKTVDKQIEKNKVAIENAICQAINEAVPIKKEVEAVWNLLSNTQRIAKKPIDIWLTTVPKDFSAKFENEIKDTLRVLVFSKTGVLITPLKGMELTEIPELSANKDFEEIDQLDLRVSLNMPYEYMDLILNSQLDGRKVEYAGLSSVLTDFNTSTFENQLKLEFKTKGDIEINLAATTQPILSSESELIFDNLQYEIVSDNPLMNSLDWVSNSSIDTYLLDYSKIQLSYILDSLDSKIIKALDRSNLSSKIGMDLSFSKIQSDTIIYYNDRFEWIFSVKGKAHAYLSDSLVEKK